MNRKKLVAAALGVLTIASPIAAGPVNWSVGVRLGGPSYYPGYYRPYPMYIAPAPYYVSPPVYLRPAPIIVEEPRTIYVPSPTPSSTYSAQPSYSATTTGAVTTVSGTNSVIEGKLQLLGNADERVRYDTVMELGRLKAGNAIDPLAVTLASDKSSNVRDAAARALGLIGSPRALTALSHAAQSDPDRDVRRSAQFAVDVIQTNQR